MGNNIDLEKALAEQEKEFAIIRNRIKQLEAEHDNLFAEALRIEGVIIFLKKKMWTNTAPADGALVPTK